MYKGADTCTSADTQGVSHTQRPQIWELELQTAVCWVLRTELRTSVRAVLAPNHWDIPPVPLFISPLPPQGNGRDVQTNTIASNKEQYIWLRTPEDFRTGRTVWEEESFQKAPQKCLEEMKGFILPLTLNSLPLQMLMGFCQGVQLQHQKKQGVEEASPANS